MQNLPQGGGVGAGGHTPAGTGPSDRKACDQCRLRKIRCDKEWPCSNCRTAQRTCTSTGAGQKPREARQRVLISSQYERKIDQIESRLGSIEGLLRTISSGHLSPGDSSRQPTHTPATGSSSVQTTGSIADFDSSEDESAFGGDQGFTSQTAFASEFLENAVGRTSLRDANPGIQAALANLRGLVEMQKRRSISHGPRFPLQKPLPPGGLVKLPLPPMDVVIPLLKQHKSGPPSLFVFSCALVGINDFSSLCRVVYFPSEDFSQATFAIVNSGLYNLFMEEAALTEDQAKRDEYQSYAELAQANLETYLANLPLFLSAKIENVQALLLGSQYAIDVSRPSVAWHLNSTAAQLCQSGGFHRADLVRNDSPTVRQTKANLFWQVYTWDKGLGLRLGRASVIKDCDISIPRSFDFAGWIHLEESGVPMLWLRTSELQGRIYEHLYSPAALMAPAAELSRRAGELAIECRNLEPEMATSRDETMAYLKAIKSSTLVDMFIKGDEVQFLTTMTLVFQAIPAPEGSPSRFCKECLDSARKAIQAHQESLSMLHYGSYMKSIYVHWNLMLTPFAPFFVLFCHVIETLSAEDLQVLLAFVTSIEAIRDASETIDKLCRVFQMYRDVAVVYVEAKSQHQADQSMAPIGDEFDMYLGQLGFMPMDDQTMMQPDPLNPVQAGGNGQAAQMADWFSGSRNMFGLLEEDLSQINTKWMPGS